MTGSIAIRSADPDRDAAACAAIYRPHVLAGPTSFEEEPPSAAAFAQRIADCSGAYPWLVLEHEKEVVGYAYACSHRTRPAYRWAVDVSIYIAEGSRGRGLGRQLYRELLERVRRQRFRVACAGITLPNEASVALHESLGFARVGVYRGIGWKAGAWRDVGWWQLELGPAGDGRPADPLPPAP